MSGEWIRPLICPVCAQPLGDYGQVWQCPAGHSFDVAREGYVNLRRSHKKLPETVGDSPEMLRARREFLARGFYEPLSDVINEMVVTAVASQPDPVIVDVGCGEGYYLRRLAARLAGQPAALFGVDIAKTAVRLAAKRGGVYGRYLVADVNEQLPFADHSVHVLLNLFAPRHLAEFARLVAPGGLLLIAMPAPDHLQSLRDRFALIGIQPEKLAHVTAQFTGLFAIQPAQAVTFPLRLENETLQWLIQMMPGVRHLTPEQQEAIAHTAVMETVASLVVVVMRRDT